MDMISTLRAADGGAGLAALSRSFGLSESETESVVRAVAPQIVAHIERNTLSRGGLADLLDMLAAVEALDIAAPAAIGTDTARTQGNALLEQLVGTRDKSRAIAAKASYASGIGDSLIKAMLPYIISMVLKAVLARAGGGLGDIVSKLPGGTGGSGRGGAPSGGGLEDILRRIPELGGRTGSPAPPPTPAPSQAPRGAPRGGGMLPGPEGMEVPGRNPYGDLSDVIRRGGTPSASGGGALWRNVRDVLGGAMGFQSKGILGWIFKAIVLRYGWTILRSVLGRMLFRR